jgi:hypothetical protein
MTPDEYYAAIKNLGLRRSKNVRTVFFDNDEMPHRVPLPEDLTPEQREEIIAKKKEQLGILPKQD